MDGYTQLAEIIDAHGYRLARQAGELPSPEQVAADWYETVYRPGLEAVRRAGLPEVYASWNPTDVDLFLWVYKIRRDLRGQDDAIELRRGRDARARSEIPRAFATPGPARRQPTPPATTA